MCFRSRKNPRLSCVYENDFHRKTPAEFMLYAVRWWLYKEPIILSWNQTYSCRQFKYFKNQCLENTVLPQKVNW